MRSAQSAPICWATYGVLGGGSQEGAGSREQGAGSGKWRCNRRVRLAQMGCAATHGRLSDSCHEKIPLSGRVAAHQLAIVTFKAADAAYHPRSRALLRSEEHTSELQSP